LRKDAKGCFVRPKEESSTFFSKHKDKMRVSVETKLPPISFDDSNKVKKMESKESFTKIVSFVDSKDDIKEIKNYILMQSFEERQDYIYFRKKFNSKNMIDRYNIFCRKDDDFDELSSLVRTTLKFQSMGEDALRRILNSKAH
jgi:hypothetical protein